MKKKILLLMTMAVMTVSVAMAQGNFNPNAAKWPKSVNLKQDISKFSYQDLNMLKALVYAIHGRWYTEAEINRTLCAKAEWYEEFCSERASKYYEQNGWENGEFDYTTVKLSAEEKAFVDKIDRRMAEIEQQKGNPNGMETTDLCINMNQLVKPSKDMLGKLNTYNFAIEKSNCDQLFNIYEKNDYEMMPSFVTTDLYLQLAHMYLAYVQKKIEKSYFTPTLQSTMEAFNKQIAAARQNKVTKRVSDHLDYLQTYFAIGLKLLTDQDQQVPSTYSAIYAQELKNVMKEENTSSPLMKTAFDFFYSLFKPRGHYTRSEEQKRFFRSMMWVQTATFLSNQDEAVERATMMAMLFNAMPQAKQTDFRHMSDIITQLTGPSDNVSILQLAEWLHSKGYKDLSIVNDEKAMAEVKAELKRLNNVNNQLSTIMEEEQGFNINLMPQRFLCDNEVLKEMADPKANAEKAYPSGVNVFAVFGSPAAQALQDTFYHDAQKWDDFNEVYKGLNKKYGTKENSPIANGTIYDRRLQLLVDLATRTDRNQYAFYNTPHWQLKDLNTSLASWATLKHDAILYAEQPMLAECGGGENLPEPAPMGFVEPNKIFWDQLALLIKDTQDWLKNSGYLDDDIASKTEQLLESIDFCKTMAEKEVAGEVPSYDECMQIKAIGSSIEWMTLGLLDPDLEVGSWTDVTGADRKIAQVADVFSRAVFGCDKQGILYAACGNANMIYVIVKIGDKRYLTRGGVYGYHEFVRPFDESRLNDEEWQEMLEKGKAPGMPEWMEPYILPTGSKAEVNERYLYSSGC